MTKRGDYFHEKGSEWNVETVASVACWVTTGLLILFMASVLLMQRFFGDTMVTWVADVIWLPLLIYINVQLWGTSQRESTDMGQWFLDNLLALIVVLFGLVLFCTPKFWTYGRNEWSIIAQCTAFGLTDLAWGLAFSQRIAFAGKERGETRI